MAACVNLENALRSGEHKDIDGHELFAELIIIQKLIQGSMGPLDILKFLKKLRFYSNAIIACRNFVNHSYYRCICGNEFF